MTQPDDDCFTLCEAVTWLATGEAMKAETYRGLVELAFAKCAAANARWERAAGECEVVSWRPATRKESANRAATRLARRQEIKNKRANVRREADALYDRIEAAGHEIFQACWDGRLVLYGKPYGRKGGEEYQQISIDRRPLPIRQPMQFDPANDQFFSDTPGAHRRDEANTFIVDWVEVKIPKRDVEALRQPPKAAATPTEPPKKRNGTPGPARHDYPKVRKYIDYEIARDIGVDGPREPDRERGRLFLESAKWEDVFERVRKFLDMNFKDNWSAADWPAGRTRRVEILKGKLKSHGIDR